MVHRLWVGSFLGIFLCSLFFIQCNSPVSLCSRYYEALDTKLGSCSIPGLDKRTTTEKISDCSSRVEQCNATDRQAISDSITCFEKLAVCQFLSSLSWLSEAAPCTKKLDPLSQTCRAAFTGLSSK